MKRSVYNLIGGVVIFCLIVLLLNSLLSLVGLEKYDKEFNPRSSTPLFVSGEGELSQYFVTNPQLSFALNYQAFPKKKQDGTTRIFVVGGSAAYAWPFFEQYGFSGYLRRALDRYAPGKFEIINAAGMSYGSHRVYGALQEIVLFDPDLVIVYSGNNEYVERNVVAGLTANLSKFDRVGAFLGRMHLYRAVRLSLFRVAPSLLRRNLKNDLTVMSSASVVSRGTIGRSVQVDSEVFSNFRDNTKAMKDLLSTSGVKGIFCTVASNVAGWHPEMTLPRFVNNEQAASWHKLQNDVAAALDAHKQTALDSTDNKKLLLREKYLLEEMLKLTPDHAGTLYLLGQVMMRLGEYDRAYHEFVRAKDLDVRPVRELTVFNDALREIVGGSISNANFELVDLEKILGDEVRRGAPDGIFLDYCHLTEEAHKSVAIFMLPAIQKMLGRNLPLAQMSEWIFHDNYGAVSKDAKMLATEYYARGLTYSHNKSYMEAEEAFKQVLRLEPDASGPFVSEVFAGLGGIYLARGDQKRFREMLFKSLEANPANHLSLIMAGFVYLEDGEDLAKAAEMFRQAIQLNPYAPKAYEGLGRIAMLRGELQEAITHYREALRLVGDDPGLQKELGKAFIGTGDVKNALVAWRASLALDSFDQETWNLLEKYARQ